ncbi:MAG: phosphate uptake regulator PhoU, partial [Lachnospiraceae bacterium]|nr:phosphate uptake regulator PhoU [Lachnospiraceae bacterium]
HISTLDQYYRVVTEFEKIGDEAVHISKAAKDISGRELAFSEIAQKELRVLFGLVSRILEYTSLAFRKLDIDAAYRIEPLEEVADELCSAFKVNHLNRMGSGMCNLYADTNFMNLLSSAQHIASACTNIGEATVIRVRPELATKEHNYFESLRSGTDEGYNEAYREARAEYFGMLPPESVRSGE